mgnify:CR=1 FL=1
MKNLQLENRHIAQILSDISNLIDDRNNQDILQKISFKEEDKNICGIYPCDLEYLDKAITVPENYNFPLDWYGFEFKYYNKELDKDVVKHIFNESMKLQEYLGLRTNTLKMYYPPGGYIGWHHNGNAPGQNILFTYSATGDGSFKYYDYDSAQIISVPDKKGWSVKAGYYPKYNNSSDKVFWHCAETNCPRITVAFIIDNQILWNDVIDEIEGED